MSPNTLSTTLPSLDEDIEGFLPGSFNLIAGPVMSYKTTLLRRILCDAVKSGRRSTMFSESLPEHEWEALDRMEPGFRYLRGGDRLQIKTFDTREFFSLLEADHDYDVVAVDNLHFPMPPESSHQPINRIFQAYSEGATQIHNFSRRTNVPVIATMQLRKRIAEVSIVNTLPALSLYEIADTILFTKGKELGVTVGKARNYNEKAAKNKTRLYTL